MGDFFVWLISNIGMSVVNFVNAVLNPSSWLAWIGGLNTPEAKQSLMNFVYYGGSVEFFFVILLLFIVVTLIGLWRSSFLWGVVRVIEGFGNSVGRLAAWAALFMVIQQVMIVFLQRIFRVSEISLGPFGMIFTKDLSWFGEELKFYNAIIVALCCAYTFVQGGHVRVDLFYANVKFRTKKVVDMFGSLFFMVPAMVLMWLYSWFFMWRHLITPKVSASDKIELLLRKATIAKWNVETIGFSPNGFNGYFLFKILIVAFCAMMFLQALAFFYRSLLEYREGEASENKYLDKDRLDDDVAEIANAAH